MSPPTGRDLGTKHILTASYATLKIVGVLPKIWVLFFSLLHMVGSFSQNQISEIHLKFLGHIFLSQHYKVLCKMFAGCAAVLGKM